MLGPGTAWHRTCVEASAVVFVFRVLKIGFLWQKLAKNDPDVFFRSIKVMSFFPL